MKKTILRQIAVAAVVAVTGAAALAQQGTLNARRQAAPHRHREAELQSIAVVERKVMMPMPDGVRLATDIYRPKNADRQGADRLGADALQLQLLGHPERRAGRHDARSSTAVKRGYAYVVQNERGHFFSEGNYDILGSQDRRLQHGRLADEAGLVERQDRHDRLFVDRRVSDGRRCAQAIPATRR